MHSVELQPVDTTEPVGRTADTQTVKRLADVCTEVLMQSPAEPESLYQLSTVEIVELCSRVLKECQVAKEVCQTAREELHELQSVHRYFVNPPRSNDRCDLELYDRQQLICDKWEVMEDYPSGGERPSPAGRLVPTWDKERNRVYCAAEESRLRYLPQNLEYRFYKLISSPLLLYRLWCTFKISKVQEGDGYKCIWSYFVKHNCKESGIWVGFSEHKAAAKVWSDRKPPTSTSFDLNWLDLLTSCLTQIALISIIAPLLGLWHEYAAVL